MQRQKRRRSRRPNWLAAIAVLGYLGLLVFVSSKPAALGTEAPTVSVWELREPETLLNRFWPIVISFLWQVVSFVPVGILLPLALPRVDKGLKRLFAVFLPAAVLGVVLSFVVRGFQSGPSWDAPGARDLVLPVLGCLFGVWAGMHLLRGFEGLVWFLPKLAVLIAACAAIPIAGLYLATDAEPLPIEGARVTSERKRDFLELLKKNNPAKLEEGEIPQLTLTSQDLDFLLAWGLSVVGRGAKGQVETAPEAMRMRGSVRLPVEIGSGQYLNFLLGVKGAVLGGELDLSLDALRIGRIVTPDWMLGIGSSFLAASLRSDRVIGPIIEGIEELRLDPDAVRVTYGKMDVRGEVLPRLVAELGPDEAVLAGARAQIQNLSAAVPDLPSGGARFGACLETAFALAAARSEQTGAMVENHGAILALGAVLGHSRLATVVGLEPEVGAIEELREQLGEVRVRERADWTKHFLLSAGLATLSGTDISDAAGLLKEELDAATKAGGSGFSFGDLLADRAGTRFTWAATDTEQRARAMQARLERGFHLDDFFPRADGLPEGINEEDFETDYGGVGGARYTLLSQSIEKRLRTCAAYR